MIGRRLVICLPFLALVAGAALAEAPRSVPFDQAVFDAALAEGRPILVDVSAPWCPTCRAQKEVFATLFQQPKYAGLTVLEVDFDSRKDLLRLFGAQKQSTLIVYVGGVEVARSVGQSGAKTIEALLDAAY